MHLFFHTQYTLSEESQINIKTQMYTQEKFTEKFCNKAKTFIQISFIYLLLSKIQGLEQKLSDMHLFFITQFTLII